MDAARDAPGFRLKIREKLDRVFRSDRTFAEVRAWIRVIREARPTKPASVVVLRPQGGPEKVGVDRFSLALSTKEGRRMTQATEAALVTAAPTAFA